MLDCNPDHCGQVVNAGGKTYCVRCAAAEIERLRAVVDKLPKTADGVPVVPGAILYRVPGNRGYVSGEQCGFFVAGVTSHCVITAMNNAVPVISGFAYSTRAAADEAAKPPRRRRSENPPSK